MAQEQVRGFGGTFSFRLRGGQETAFKLLGGVRLFTLAESRGGVEALIEHPATMTHAPMPPAVREAMGITPDLIRISVRLEDVGDLIEDLEQALGRWIHRRLAGSMLTAASSAYLFSHAGLADT